MRKVTEDKIIATLAVLGMATIITAIVAATIIWIDPFFSRDTNGNPTLFGTAFVYVLYTAEALAGLFTLWMGWLAFCSFVPKTGHIKHLPIESAKNITGRTHGIN